MSVKRPERYRPEWQDLRDVSAFLEPGHLVLELEDWPTARQALRRAVEVCGELEAGGWIGASWTLRVESDRRRPGCRLFLAGGEASERLALEVSSRVLEGSDEGWT